MPRIATFSRSKTMINISTGVGTTDITKQLKYPSTTEGASIAKGLRWSISIIHNNPALTAPTPGVWLIVRCRESETPNTINLADGQNLYEPTTDVLAWNTFINKSGREPGPVAMRMDGISNAQRKMSKGDTLWFITVGVNSITKFDIFGCVNVFAKK
jgi:hypothetical protein